MYIKIKKKKNVITFLWKDGKQRAKEAEMKRKTNCRWLYNVVRIEFILFYWNKKKKRKRRVCEHAYRNKLYKNTLCKVFNSIKENKSVREAERKYKNNRKSYMKQKLMKIYNIRTRSKRIRACKKK